MLVDPAPTAETSPVVGFTVATAVLELLQVPPEVELVNVVVPPTQIVFVPATAPGVAHGGVQVLIVPFGGMSQLP